MKLKICLFLIFIALLTGCAVKFEQPPAPTLDQNAVKNFEMHGNYSRVIFYSGDAGRVQLDRAIDIFIDNFKIGSIGNKEEMIAVDLPPGTYSFKCNIPEKDIDHKYIRPDILTLSIRDNQQIYLRANLHDETPAAAMLLGPFGALTLKLAMAFEQDNAVNGRQAIATHRLVARYIMPGDSINEQKTISERFDQQQFTPLETNLNENDLEKRMLRLKQLYDSGLITEEEYDLKRKEVIEKL